jgi:hypothetical protein
MDAPDELKGIRDEIDAAYARDGEPTAGQLRREYTALANRNKTLILRFSRRTKLLLAALTVGMLLLGGESLKLTVDIQESRTEQCKAGNERHVNTEVELEKAIEELHGALHREAVEREKSTERLLNALAPLRNCSSLG